MRDRPRVPAPRGPPATLPIRPEPLPGESFTSYVDRLAAFWGVRLQTMLALTGIVNEDHGSCQPVAYGITLSPERLRTFSYVTRLSEERVLQMLLASYDGVACDFGGLDLYNPKFLRDAARRQWAYFAGSHACPSCLRGSGGAWKLAWKLPWSFACARDRCLLIDTCPACDRRTGIGRLDAKCSPPFTSMVPVPDTCRNALRPVQDLPRSSPGVCGNPLADLEPPTLDTDASSGIVEAQLRLDEALAGNSQFVGGVEVPSLEYFRDLRSLCAMILSLGTAEDLGDAPSQVREAFALYVEGREALRNERATLVASGGHWRGGPHHKPYTTTPQSAAVMAAIVPRAITLLDAPSPEKLAASLEPFILRLKERNTNFLRDINVFVFSERLTGALETFWKPRSKTVSRLGMGRGETKPKDPAHSGLKADNVPQLLWKDTYDTLFANLLGSRILSEEYSRAFCSIALVKLTGDHTWEEAGLELGMPEGRGRNIGNAGIALLNRTAKTDLFRSRLHGLDKHLAQESHLTDYGFRRRAFTDLDDIASEEWTRMCEAAGMQRGRPGRRSGAASAWLWCHLTGGHRPLAPWFLQNDDPASSMVYHRFTNEALHKLQADLVAYGEDILKQRSE